MECAFCQKPMGPPRVRFCSRQCANRFEAKRRSDMRAAHRATFPARHCPCGNAIRSIRADARFCSHRCRNREGARLRDIQRRSVPCIGCEKPFVPKAATNVYCSKECRLAHAHRDNTPLVMLDTPDKVGPALAEQWLRLAAIC